MPEFQDKNIKCILKTQFLVLLILITYLYCSYRLENGNINFEKFWQLAKQISELVTWQQVQVKMFCNLQEISSI